MNNHLIRTGHGRGVSILWVYLGSVFLALVALLAQFVIWLINDAIVEAVLKAIFIERFMGLSIVVWSLVLPLTMVATTMVFHNKVSSKAKWFAGQMMALILILIIQIGCLNVVRHQLGSFNRDIWLRYPTVRHYMVHDLMAETNHIGKTMFEMKAYLGEPLWTNEETLFYDTAYGWFDSENIELVFEEDRFIGFR